MRWEGQGLTATWGLPSFLREGRWPLASQRWLSGDQLWVGEDAPPRPTCCWRSEASWPIVKTRGSLREARPRPVLAGSNTGQISLHSLSLLPVLTLGRNQVTSMAQVPVISSSHPQLIFRSLLPFPSLGPDRSDFLSQFNNHSVFKLLGERGTEICIRDTNMNPNNLYSYKTLRQATRSQSWPIVQENNVIDFLTYKALVSHHSIYSSKYSSLLVPHILINES